MEQPLLASAPRGADERAHGDNKDSAPAATAAADTTVAIEMRPGVSSLNLATAAAVVLYAGRGAARGPDDAG